MKIENGELEKFEKVAKITKYPFKTLDHIRRVVYALIRLYPSPLPRPLSRSLKRCGYIGTFYEDVYLDAMCTDLQGNIESVAGPTLCVVILMFVSFCVQVHDECGVGDDGARKLR